MSFYVYILKCADGSYYTGHTDSMELRLAQHNRGEIPGYTASRRPLKLVHAESFTSRDEAFRAERQIKGWSRRKKEALIDKDWERLKVLSKTSQSKIPTHPSTSSG
ncbi:MAG: GIY-YIG nuclease family protein [Elusimicrobia bacterium]|nr:GIY-YIG nuclease family protein [Elusimicrobiota bacterium]